MRKSSRMRIVPPLFGRPLVPVFHGFSKGAFGSFTYLDFRTISPPPTTTQTYLSLEINEECPLQCIHCMYKRELSAPLLKEHELIDWLTDARRSEIPIIWTSISGKEPLATPDFLGRVAEAARPMSMKQIIMTNGLYLTPGQAQRYVGLIDYIDVSLDGTKDVHEKIRGRSTFARTWQNVKSLAWLNSFERIGIITTLHAQNYPSLRGFIKLIERELFPITDRISISINFYVGWPDDPMRLKLNDVLSILRVLSTLPIKTTVPLLGAYYHMAPAIFQEFELSLKDLKYDVTTGIPSIDLNGHKIILFNLATKNSITIRVSSDGEIFFGCTHIMKKGPVHAYSIGDIRRNSLAEVTSKVLSGEAFPKDLFSQETECEGRDCYSYCMGGDRLAGYYARKSALDPFCPAINKPN